MAQILAAYLTAIKTITPQDKEHTHRAALENLLNALKNELATQHKATHTTQNAAANFSNSTQNSAQTQIYEAKDLQKFTIIHEPNNDKSGLSAPDFQVKVPTGLTLGYIENKRVGENLQNLIDGANKDEKSQIARYLKLSDNLILMDYLNFWRVRKDERGKILQSYKKIQQIYQILNKIHYNFSNF